MPQTISSIEQINLGYNLQEDRLLLKIGLVDQIEVSLWITRRICKEMWHLLQNTHGHFCPQESLASKHMPAPALAPIHNQKEQAIANFARELTQQKSLQVMDFSTEYETGRQSVSDLPMLTVRCHIIANAGHVANLQFQANDGQSINMALTLELVVALTNMMQLATREAGWDLLMLQNNTVLQLSSAEHVLH